MKTSRVQLVAVLFALLALASCGSSGSKTAATTKTTKKDDSVSSASAPSGTSESKTVATANSDTGGWPGANGCAKPSSADVGTAFGTPIVGTLPAALQGCIWKTATAGRSVQVSYHTAGGEDAMPAAQLAFLHSSGTITDLTVPGASQAFLRNFPLPTMENPNAYIVYPEGVVQIAMSGALNSIPESNQEAVVKVFTGG